MAITRTLAPSAAVLALAVTAVIALPVVQATAAIVPVSSRAELNGDVTVNWDIFGPDGTETDSPDRRIVGPITVDVNSSGGRLNRVDGGFGFANDEPLLRDSFNQDESFIITFNSPFAPRVSDSVVHGFGFELQATQPSIGNGNYSGRIVVRDSNLDDIGTVPFASNIAEDPIFVGGLSNTADIFQLEILIDWPDAPSPLVDGGFAAINRLDVVTRSAGATTVPVPATWALLLAPLAGFALTGVLSSHRRRS